MLKIMMYPEGSGGYYLLYCDSTGLCLTDTYHDAIEDAIAQAQFEFDVTPEQWIDS